MAAKLATTAASGRNHRRRTGGPSAELRDDADQQADDPGCRDLVPPTAEDRCDGGAGQGIRRERDEPPSLERSILISASLSSAAPAVNRPSVMARARFSAARWRRGRRPRADAERVAVLLRQREQYVRVCYHFVQHMLQEASPYRVLAQYDYILLAESCLANLRMH